jgi:hypothetical protein
VDDTCKFNCYLSSTKPTRHHFYLFVHQSN